MVNLAGTDGVPNAFSASFTYLRVPLNDTMQANLMRKVPICNEFISKALKKEGNKVLVHCYAGVSRSSAVILAYLVQCKGLSLQKAWRLL